MEEADQLAKLVGSNAWAKKKNKAKLKKARKQRRRLKGPLYPYSMRINGIEKNSSLTLTEWHGINSDLVGWIAGEILNASKHDDLSLLNIEEYKFIENPDKDGVKTRRQEEGLQLAPLQKHRIKEHGREGRQGLWTPQPHQLHGKRLSLPYSSGDSPKGRLHHVGEQVLLGRNR
jgi:hypothetical protein